MTLLCYYIVLVLLYPIIVSLSLSHSSCLMSYLKNLLLLSSHEHLKIYYVVKISNSCFSITRISRYHIFKHIIYQLKSLVFSYKLIYHYFNLYFKNHHIFSVFYHYLIYSYFSQNSYNSYYAFSSTCFSFF